MFKKKKIIYYFLFAAAVLACLVFLFIESNTKNASTNFTNNAQQNLNQAKPVINTNSKAVAVSSNNQAAAVPSQAADTPVNNNSVLVKFSLVIPYINESPDGSWQGAWKNACEEASIFMVEKYYLGQQKADIKGAMAFMNNLFKIENKIFGSNANTDAKQTGQLINDYSSYNALIKLNPTISDIKKEIQQKRPVIVPLYGFDLHNKNIPFLPPPRGTAYHMLVIGGYDDSTKEFITEDPGDIVAGVNHRYTYEILMGALHDYSFTTKQANGSATAIFTYPKLVKIVNDPKVYYLRDNTRQWITDEAAFKARGWSWNAVNEVTADWLDTFKIGEDIKLTQ